MGGSFIWVSVFILALAVASADHSAHYNGVWIRAVKVKLLTSTEDADGTDEVSLWMKAIDFDSWKKASVTRLRKSFHKQDMNFYKVEMSNKGETQGVQGKWETVHQDQDVFMHAIEHDIGFDDVSVDDEASRRTPKVPSRTIKKWVDAFNQNHLESMTVDYTFKFNTWGSDDFPFIELARSWGFPKWVEEAALGCLCVDALDVAMAVASGGTSVPTKVAATAARKAYKASSKKAARQALKKTTKDRKKAFEEAMEFADDLLDETEFCLFPSLVEGKSDPYYQVTFEVKPAANADEDALSGGMHVGCPNVSVLLTNLLMLILLMSV